MDGMGCDEDKEGRMDIMLEGLCWKEGQYFKVVFGDVGQI